jgi:acyl carrier protein
MASLEEQIRSTMYEAISTAMNTPIEELADDTQLIADLGAKSVNFVRIIGVLEDEFDLEIPFMEFRRKKTIGEAIGYIVQLFES